MAPFVATLPRHVDAEAWTEVRACGDPEPRLAGNNPQRISSQLTRVSHHLTAEARDRPAITSLHLLAVLTVLFKYASLVEWGR